MHISEAEHSAPQPSKSGRCGSADGRHEIPRILRQTPVPDGQGLHYGGQAEADALRWAPLRHDSCHEVRTDCQHGMFSLAQRDGPFVSGVVPFISLFLWPAQSSTRSFLPVTSSRSWSTVTRRTRTSSGATWWILTRFAPTVSLIWNPNNLQCVLCLSGDARTGVVRAKQPPVRRHHGGPECSAARSTSGDRNPVRGQRGRKSADARHGQGVSVRRVPDPINSAEPAQRGRHGALQTEESARYTVLCLE